MTEHTRSSEDISDNKEKERRGCVIPLNLGNNQQWEDCMKTTKPFEISKQAVVEAYKLVKSNKGGAGIDGQTILDFERNLKDNLYKIWNRLSSGSYIPPAVKAVPIPKKSGGVRILGVPTVSDRVAQMVIKMELEPKLDPIFHSDSYGYRPNKSAHQAIEITRKRCWEFDWVFEFDIKGLFDNINHELLMKALRKHTDNKWVLLYVQRWLNAPLQNEDGTCVARNMGTPQGGVISPLLANLFLHYAFDKWMERNFPEMKWCRYADDGLVHCKTYKHAEELKTKLDERFKECGLELHPVKTRIIYCKKTKNKINNKEISFDFLGFTFRHRASRNKNTGKVFTNFLPAISESATKSIMAEIRNWRLWRKTDTSIEDLANMYNPIIRGWNEYYGKFYPSALKKVHLYLDGSLRRWVNRKYSKLRGSRTKCNEWLVKVIKQKPKMFAHWNGRFFAVE
jgi:RNA-directed DNA polymerase